MLTGLMMGLRGTRAIEIDAPGMGWAIVSHHHYH